MRCVVIRFNPPCLEALLEINGPSVKRRPSWSLNSTTTSLPNTISTLLERTLGLQRKLSAL